MCNCKNKCSCTTTCQPTDCGCKIELASDCITLSEDLTCSNILKAQTLTEVIKQLDEYICERFDSVTNFFNLINVGTGVEIYKGISNVGKKEIRTLIDSGLINLVQGTNDITISVDEVALNTFIEANQKTYSALSTGTGSEVYKSSTVVGDNTQFNFRKLKSTDSSVTITQGIDDINITVAVIDTPPLQKINEGNGDGIIIRNRTAANYGNVGLNATDLSFSNSPSSTLGATGENSFASGDGTMASAYGSTATGVDTVASNSFSNASGYQSRATGYISHAEGSDTEASGDNSHSEGENTTASGNDSHAEGLNTTASGTNSHAEGEQTTASGETSHAQGFQTQSIGKYSHAGGNNNISNSFCETSIGIFGTTPAGSATTWIGTDRLFNVGNGLNGGALSDAVTVLKNGLATLPSVTNALITAGSGKSIVTKEYLASVNDGSETKVTAGSGISVSGSGTVGSPYSIVNTHDGSETKINAGTNITVTGSGTVGSPYVINTIDLTSITNMLPRNRGYFNNLVVSGSVGALPVSGNVTAANAAELGSSSVVTVTIANAMDNTNYKVVISVEIEDTDLGADTDIYVPMFKPISTTQFYVTLRQVAPSTLPFKVHLDVFQL